MAIVSLVSASRTETGKGAARKLRAAGQVPGVFYGRGGSAIPLVLNGKELEVALTGSQGGNVIVDLKVQGAGEADRKAIIREVQRDPVAGSILHVDFQHISLTEKITVEVPVVLVGVPTGVKDGGGILEHLLREVEVECLPTDIPAHIDVDVSALGIGDSVHVSDLKAERVTIQTEADRTVATVVPPTVLEEAKPVEEAVAEPELIAKEKKEGEEEEAPEGGKQG
jgi:large subunit ribosomal protein L25